MFVGCRALRLDLPMQAEFKRMLSEGLVAQDGKNIFIKVDSITLNMGDVVINAPVDKNSG